MHQTDKATAWSRNCEKNTWKETNSEYSQFSATAAACEHSTPAELQAS